MSEVASTERRRGRKGNSYTIAAMLVVALAVPVLLVGCGPQTPAAAVSAFYSAQQSKDWNAFLGSVLPEDVRRMTDTDLADVKKAVLANETKDMGLRFKTIPDKSNPNKATVEIVSGVLVVKDPSTGQTQRITIADYKKQVGKYPTYDAVKYKGKWYVDVPLASADRPQQVQQQ